MFYLIITKKQIKSVLLTADNLILFLVHSVQLINSYLVPSSLQYGSSLTSRTLPLQNNDKKNTYYEKTNIISTLQHNLDYILIFSINTILYQGTCNVKLTQQLKSKWHNIPWIINTYEWQSASFLRKSATTGSIQWCLMTNVLERLMCISLTRWKLATDWSCSHSSSDKSVAMSSLDVAAENNILSTDDCKNA